MELPLDGEWGLCGPSPCLLEVGEMLGCVQGAGLESRLSISVLAQLLWDEGSKNMTK